MTCLHSLLYMFACTIIGVCILVHERYSLLCTTVRIHMYYQEYIVLCNQRNVHEHCYDNARVICI